MIGVGIYVKNSPQAVALYKSAFGLTLGYHVLNKDGTYFHSELSRNGEPFCSVVESKEDTYTVHPAVELGVNFDTPRELEQAFSVLEKEGTVMMPICELPWSPCAAIVVDRFGVRWFLSMPMHKPAEGWSPESDDK